jgi:hypothetical protein
LREALPQLSRIAREVGLDLHGTVISLDGVVDCNKNRKSIFNRGMIPNIHPNPRGRTITKRGRKAIYDPSVGAIKKGATSAKKNGPRIIC